MELSGLESADVVEQVGLTDRSFSTAWDDVGRFRLYGGRVLVVRASRSRALAIPSAVKIIAEG
jgi:hypothetical protein